LSYHSLNFFHRKKFGTKVWKLSVEAGCDCPNRDGTLSTSGCLFCNPVSFSPARRRGGCGPCTDAATGVRGAGFSGQPCVPAAQKAAAAAPAPAGGGLLTITQQLDEAIGRLRRRGAARFLAYFQAGTNTYGPLAELRRAYVEAIAHPQVVGLRIATRPDCLGDDVLDALSELAAQTWLVIEIGLQTIHNRTLAFLRRGHGYRAFLDAYRRCRERGLNLGVHVILGLPDESRDDMRATARELAGLELHSVKPHNLYAVRDTALADEVAAGRVRLWQRDEYVDCLVDFLEELPGQFVIERLGGDAPPDYLVGPEWCLDKQGLRAAVEAEFRRRGSWQGRKWAGC
jgi:radical SAM protein (TIGR01212 family)